MKNIPKIRKVLLDFFPWEESRNRATVQTAVAAVSWGSPAPPIKPSAEKTRSASDISLCPSKWLRWAVSLHGVLPERQGAAARGAVWPSHRLHGLPTGGVEAGSASERRTAPSLKVPQLSWKGGFNPRPPAEEATYTVRPYFPLDVRKLPGGDYGALHTTRAPLWPWTAAIWPRASHGPQPTARTLLQAPPWQLHCLASPTHLLKQKGFLQQRHPKM